MVVEVGVDRHVLSRLIYAARSDQPCTPPSLISVTLRRRFDSCLNHLLRYAWSHCYCYLMHHYASPY